MSYPVSHVTILDGEERSERADLDFFIRGDVLIHVYILTYVKIRENRATTTFKLEGEVTSLSESSQGEVGDNREKWGDFWEKLIAIN